MSACDDIHIIQGSIFDHEGDAIVNAANSHLAHGGGIAKAIARAAVKPFSSSELRDAPVAELKAAKLAADEDIARWQNDHQNAPLIPTGGAYFTSAGRLPYKGVIHTVGPVWGGGSYNEKDLLLKAHANTFKVANQHGIEDIALPAISCGIFKYPVKKAAFIAYDEALLAIEKGLVASVTFYMFDPLHVEAFEKAAI